MFQKRLYSRGIILFVVIFVVLVPLFAIGKSISANIVEDKDRNVTRIQLNASTFIDLKNQWHEQAISGLIAAIATKTIKSLPPKLAQHHKHCSNRSKTLDDHAKCVSTLLKAKEQYQGSQKMVPIRLKFRGQFPIPPRKRRSPIYHPYNLVNRSSFPPLPSSIRSQMTSIGFVAKWLTDAVLKQKNKTHHKPWQSYLARAAMLSKKKRLLQRQKQSKLSEFPTFGIPGEETETIQPPNSPVIKLVNVLRFGIRLGMFMSGAGGALSADAKKKTIKFASPRLFSVTTEDPTSIDFLSPSLFSLHDKGRGFEKDFSLPSLSKHFSKADQQHVLDFIFEAAGIDDALKIANQSMNAELQRMKKRRYQERMTTDKGRPLYLTPKTAAKTMGDEQMRRVEVFEQLSRSYSERQKRQIDDTGYAILTPDQLHLIYGPSSPYNDSTRLDYFRRLTPSAVHDLVIRDIHQRARNTPPRSKRDSAVVLTPLHLFSIVNDSAAASTPYILSPIILASIIGSPSILGPVILGPWLFLPLIMSPRVLSPAVLDPLVFVPVILSPLVLNPVVLSPGIFNPLILSPCVLSPFVLAPQVFTPLILSPLIVNPIVMSPSIGTPMILAPSLLSPIIFTPLSFFAMVLSPQIASPSFVSQLYQSEIILSPTLFSK